MTSVVDTTVKHFHSAMSGAPVLNGVAGSLLGLLDACLVNGFDLKAAATLSVASGVATLTFTPPHSATVDSVILVAGASVAALNGEQRVTAVGSGVVKFATAAADGTATGTITFKMAGANWIKPFAGTNLAAYKSADVQSTGCLLRVDDTAAQVARVVGYEQMTDINTGSGPFPTAVQVAGGGSWAKSQVASAAAVPWVLISDGRKLIIHMSYGIPANAQYQGGITRVFGDELATKPGGDPYACSLNYALTNATTAQDGGPDLSPTAQHAMPRNYTGLGSSSLNYCRSYISSGSANSGADTTLGAFPPFDGALRLSAKFLSESQSAGVPRCNFAGLYHVPMSGVWDTFKVRDTISGTGSLAGRKLMALAPTAASGGTSIATIGVSFADISGPWR